MIEKILIEGLILGIDEKKKEEKIDLGDIDEKTLLGGESSQDVVKVKSDEESPFGDEEGSPFDEEEESPPFLEGEEGEGEAPPLDDEESPFGGEDEGPSLDEESPFGGEGISGDTEEKVSSLEEKVNQVDSVLANVRRSNDEIEEKINKIEKSMEGILSIYELVTNEINPFVEKSVQKEEEKTPEVKESAPKTREKIPSEKPEPEKIKEEVEKPEPVAEERPSPEPEEEPEEKPEETKKKEPPVEEKSTQRRPSIPLEEALQPTGTSDVFGVQLGEEKIYLDRIKSDPSSLLLMLKWLDFLIMKTGYRGMIKALLYYEDIGWVSENVRNEMIRYSKDIATEDTPNNISQKLGIRDHIVSLFFVAKLQGIKISPSLYSAVVDELEDLGLLE